ncbi:MAG: hypothetical protein VB060_01380 [Oscillibacter sp.]|nr:hypothetical protein [Oscillibacter sp.]MEA4992472.1 hypothetical protein [Oscillibacter sp.]
MAFAIVCITFALSVSRLCVIWRTNSKQENAFYVVCIGISFSVVVLQGLKVSIPDPTQFFVEWLKSVGIS